MKKILSIFLIATAIMFSVPALSQTSLTQTASNSTGAITSSTSDTMTSHVVGFYSYIGIQYLVTRTSGTAGGTAYLAGSIDGVNYVNTDTITIVNGAKYTTILTKQNSVTPYFRIITVGGGTTMVATTSGKIIARKP